MADGKARGTRLTNYDARITRQVKREWDKWIDALIKEMEDDLVCLLTRVERLKSNLTWAKWIKRTQGKRKSK